MRKIIYKNFWALFKIVPHEVHVPKSCPARIFEPFLKSCPSKVCVPRGRVPRGLTVFSFQSFNSSFLQTVSYNSVMLQWLLAIFQMLISWSSDSKTFFSFHNYYQLQMFPFLLVWEPMINTWCCRLEKQMRFDVMFR